MLRMGNYEATKCIREEGSNSMTFICWSLHELTNHTTGEEAKRTIKASLDNH